MDLTPEQRQRIYQEEKARLEAEAMVELRRKVYEEERDRLAQEEAAEAEQPEDAPPPPAITTTRQTVTMLAAAFAAMCAVGLWLYVAAPTLFAAPAPTPEPTLYESEELKQAKANLVKIAAMKANIEDAKRSAEVKFIKWEIDDDSGYMYVYGQVTNRSKHDVTYWDVQARFLDASDRVLDMARANSAELLRPGDTKKFKIMHSQVQGAKAVSLETVDVRPFTSTP